MDTPFKLTERQTEILLLLAQDFTLKEIAAQLSISSRTAEKHSENLLKNLRVKSAASAIVRAHQQKIINITGINIRV